MRGENGTWPPPGRSIPSMTVRTGAAAGRTRSGSVRAGAEGGARYGEAACAAGQFEAGRERHVASAWQVDTFDDRAHGGGRRSDAVRIDQGHAFLGREGDPAVPQDNPRTVDTAVAFAV